MVRIIPYNELLIVGYSTEPEVLPAVLTMVFRHGENFVFAPYRLTPQGLRGGAYDTPYAFEKRVQAGDAAKLDKPISPEYGKILWMDEDGDERYSLKQEVAERLEQVSKGHLARAESALREHKFDEALDWADRALSVDEETIYALVVAAAAYHLQGKSRRAERLSETAQVILKGFSFERHVDELIASCKSIQLPTSCETQTALTVNKFSGMAAVRPYKEAA